MVKLYGYKKCSTCSKAEKALSALGVNYEYIDITEKPPSATALKKMMKQADIDLKKWFNTSGVAYREQNLKETLPTLSTADAIALLASNGKLIKRPIVTDGQATTVGFKEADFNATWR